MSELNALNYLNLVGFIINCLVTFFASTVFGFPSNGDLSDKYQTIVTPSGFTFSIWGIIFAFQGVFSVIQMLSAYRDNILVQEGVQYWYFIACMFQSAWTFAFGYEVIWLSTTMMGGILISLAILVRLQSKIESEPSLRIKDFWLLKFPFSIHCGWIAAAFAVNVNVLVLDAGTQARGQEIWAFNSLLYAVLVAVCALVYLKPPDFTIPSVLVWATFGIFSELRKPKDAIVNTFTEAVITRFRATVIGVCVVLAVATTGYGLYRNFKKKNDDTVENPDEAYQDMS